MNYLFGNLDRRKNDLVGYLLECKIRLKTLIKTIIKKSLYLKELILPNSMEKFEEFEHRIKRALNNMDAKISYLHDATGQLKNSFGEFQEEMDEFMHFVGNHVSDHEQRLIRIEKHMGN